MKTILCVDDDPHLLELIEATLAGPGYRLRTARDGGEAIAIATQEDVDVVILDWNMPDCAGIEVARRLTEGRPHLTVVMLTARTRPEDLARARAAGVSAYLTKPFSPLQLLQCIRESLARPRAASDAPTRVQP